MKTLHIGGVVSCQEPGCFKVFGTLADWQNHWDEVHGGQGDDYRYAEPTCAAHGVMRGC